jgi:hypothetical protein
MIIKCQHTGFEFEAQTARSKNHPMVSDFLNAAAKDNGHYRGASHTAKQLVSEATGYDTIEELIADAKAAYAAWQETGESRKVVKSFGERQEAGRRAIAAMERQAPGFYEEATDGNGFSNPRR